MPKSRALKLSSGVHDSTANAAYLVKSVAAENALQSRCSRLHTGSARSDARSGDSPRCAVCALSVQTSISRLAGDRICADRSAVRPGPTSPLTIRDRLPSRQHRAGRWTRVEAR